MFDIKTLNKISPLGTDLFDRNKYEISDECQSPEGILVRSASMLDMDMDENLLAIARAGAGVNNIPVEKCSEQGIVVFNTPGANANAVKEMVIAGMLLASRDILGGIDWTKTLKGKGSEVSKLVEKGKSQFVGPEIMGKTIGVIGLGAIGVLVSNVCASMGLKVLGYDPYISVTHAWGLSPKVVHVSSLSEIYEKADYITLHLPFNGNTKGTINSEALAMMKQGVKILNFARGELVENDDILEALKSGKVGKYVTDFPTDEQIGADNVIAIPHLGASTPESEDNCAKMASKQIIDYLENGNIVNSVNMPNVEMSRSGKARICVVHKNNQGMISKISGIISDANINIENFTNKSRNEYAYTMLDVATKISTDNISGIEKIEGVIKVRLI